MPWWGIALWAVMMLQLKLSNILLLTCGHCASFHNDDLPKSKKPISIQAKSNSSSKNILWINPLLLHPKLCAACLPTNLLALWDCYSNSRKIGLIAPIIKTSWLNTQNWQVLVKMKSMLALIMLNWKTSDRRYTSSTWQIRHWLNTNFYCQWRRESDCRTSTIFILSVYLFDPLLGIAPSAPAKTLTKNKTCTSRNRIPGNDMSNFSRLRLQGFKSFVENQIWTLALV